jgi:hypothetical protein
MKIHVLFLRILTQMLRAIHHEEFMVVRKLELSTLDDHCEIINELAIKPDWDWH